MLLDTETLWRTALELATHGRASTMKEAMEDALEALRILQEHITPQSGSARPRKSSCKKPQHKATCATGGDPATCPCNTTRWVASDDSGERR